MNTSNQYGPLNGYSRSILKVITGKNVLLRSFEAAESREQKSTESKNELQFSIYPNPNIGDKLFLKGVDLEKEPNIQVYNQLGQLMVNEKLVNNKIGISLDAGVYFVRLIQLGIKNEIQKLIIQ